MSARESVSQTTAEIFAVNPKAAAARVVAGLIHAELKRWKKDEERGVLHDPAQREALAAEYQDAVRRSMVGP
jgi:hypothetical protein